jgi:hypothetical protein
METERNHRGAGDLLSLGLWHQLEGNAVYWHGLILFVTKEKDRWTVDEKEEGKTWTKCE